VCADVAWFGLSCRRFRRLSRCDSGTAAVEFAFVLPLLITLLIGIYVAGALLHSVSSVSYALEETARMLQMNSKLTEQDLQAALDKKLGYFGNQAVTLVMTVDKDSYGSSIARLTASYPYTLAVPFIPKYEGAYRQTVEVFLVISP
jgi:Flp pilus assembly protein TadG